jgi:hypothetical protein
LEEVDPKYHVQKWSIQNYITRECLFLTYQGHWRDREVVEAIPLYPEGGPGQQSLQM